MLPNKISTLIQKLRTKTESGEIAWELDSDNSTVSAKIGQLNIDISITYHFDIVEEVGTFRIDIFDNNANQPLIFHTSQLYQDYELVRALYDSAQASGFNFAF